MYCLKFVYNKTIVLHNLICILFLVLKRLVLLPPTLFETENERQKTKPVPNLLPRASRNFPDVKTRNEKKFYNWTSEIIPFIRFGKQMDRT
jgi:hypothetical protein